MKREEDYQKEKRHTSLKIFFFVSSSSIFFS